jgi:hypothetical protein
MTIGRVYEFAKRIFDFGRNLIMAKIKYITKLNKNLSKMTK